jgi:hypothetical protein
MSKEIGKAYMVISVRQINALARKAKRLAKAAYQDRGSRQRFCIVLGNMPLVKFPHNNSIQVAAHDLESFIVNS